MKPYAWTCLACDETNAAAMSTCTRCACPAQARAAQIESARNAYRHGAGLPAPAVIDPLALARSLPLLPIGAFALLLLGALMLIVDMGASASAFGGLLIALAALCVSAYRKPAAAPAA